ncbi:Maelstrom domain-containing protein [Entamoeba marina]
MNLTKVLTDMKENVGLQIMYIIDFQIHYKTESFTAPIEVCIKPFTLVPTESIPSFHEIINDQTPLDHCLNALHYSSTEHGITPENNPSSPTNYEQLWRRMNAFVRDNSSKHKDKSPTPIILCKPLIGSFQCIEFIAKKAKQESRKSAFKTIYGIDDLLGYIYHVQNIVPNINAIARIFQPLITWNSDAQFKCEFHKKHGDRPFCCSKTNVEYLKTAVVTAFQPAAKFVCPHSF